MDLNKLEFAKFDTDFDSFDIDGSRIEGLDEVVDSGPTSPLLARPTSPGGLSSKSWNSHTHYHQFKEPPDDYGWGGSRGPGPGPGHIIRPLQAAVCYCDISVLKTPRTLLRVLVLVSPHPPHPRPELTGPRVSGYISSVSVQPGDGGHSQDCPHRTASRPQAALHLVRQSRQRPLLSPRHLPQHIPPPRPPTNGLCQNGAAV